MMACHNTRMAVCMVGDTAVLHHGDILGAFSSS